MNSKEKTVEQKVLLNYFPNDQSKSIDYVIYYEVGPQTTDKNKQMRNKFIKQLKLKDGFEIQILFQKTEEKKQFYVLLNCPLERLMIEAERMHLELPLKSVSFFECYG